MRELQALVALKFRQGVLVRGQAGLVINKLVQTPTQARLATARTATAVAKEVQGSGFRVQGSGFRVQGAGFRVQDSGCRVQGAGFRVQGEGTGLGCGV